MKSKGLIYSDNEIRAMLSGTKTQTRRLTGLEEFNANPDKFSSIRIGMPGAKCPWQVGDEIYAKETWKVSGIVYWGMDANIEYKADGATFLRYIPKDLRPLEPDEKWRSPLVMPRWAARPELVRTLKSIRVERVGDISEDGADTEGVNKAHLSAHFRDGTWCTYYRAGFKLIWNTKRAKLRAVYGGSKWAKALGWTWANRLDIVGYISFPFAAVDGDQRIEIKDRPHFRCVNPWCWVLGF